MPAQKGRPPKPTHLKVVEGNRGKRPLPKSEPKPTTRLIKPPTGLTAAQRKNFLYFLKLLEEVKTAYVPDVASMLLLCDAKIEYEMHKAEIKETGAFLWVFTDNGKRRMANPAVAHAQRTRDQLFKLLNEFGMTPSGRARLGIALDNAKDDNPEAEFLD